MTVGAIFLDRDGVLNENRLDHVKGWAEFRFIPGVLQALRDLMRLNAPIFVVSNQAAINRRLVSRATVDDIHRRMIAQVRRAGADIRAVLYCPHEPSEGCACRKPAPGLIFEAAARFDIDLGRSVLVGDAWTDIVAGQRADCRTVLVRTGRGHGQLRVLAEHGLAPPTAVAADLLGAVPIIAALLQEELVATSSGPVMLPQSVPPFVASTRYRGYIEQE